MRMGGSDNTGEGLASQPRHYRVPCSTGIRWGVSPAAQMGCLRNRRGAHQGQTSREGERDDKGPPAHTPPTPATHPGAPRSPPIHPWSPQPDPVYPCTAISLNRNIGR